MNQPQRLWFIVIYDCNLLFMYLLSPVVVLTDVGSNYSSLLIEVSNLFVFKSAVKCREVVFVRGVVQQHSGVGHFDFRKYSHCQALLGYCLSFHQVVSAGSSFYSSCLSKSLNSP